MVNYITQHCDLVLKNSQGITLTIKVDVLRLF